MTCEHAELVGSEVSACHSLSITEEDDDMPTTNAFDSYTARLYGGSSDRTGIVLCYQGSSFVGRIDFYRPGVTLPDDYLWHPGGTGDYIVLNMRIRRFSDVMDLVRNEEPLQLYIDVERESGASTSGHGYLETSDSEPVGEEEGGP